MELYTEKIRKNYNTFTKRQKVIAKYIIDFPKEVALQTAKQSGKSCGVSETTVIRLCYLLGYSGYSELQKEIQTNLLEDTNYKNPIENFRKMSSSLKDTNLIQYVIEQDNAYIKATLEDIDINQFQKAVEKLIETENRIVLGFRPSYGPANWFMFALNIVIGNTTLYRGEIEDANYLLSSVDENTAVVAITFPRYIQETFSFVKAAKKKGAFIIAITDDQLSPIGQYADILFKVIAPTPIPLKGITPTFSLLNLLVTSIAASENPKVQNHLASYDQNSTEYYPFTKTEKMDEELRSEANEY
ncbi:MurR/RpiR family transcriptional regulator [Robertmurraya yapensis]|uniref:MurR/RpiR family transcriptional regulator n=1 Tax=Bacillus yapensis TaxID=2492960 RepID=A0A3S0IGX2_9BACI|nr:MurR/RpiR family transcriptional regulator [Bacillus yapensis]RTR35194.1 MurR/RpiR family transcriptional regulator [Bacillus yapensis]TKS97703.1 SIS domain-containing protein [Bacillus yapensis]